jgi:polygalacturonase
MDTQEASRRNFLRGSLLLLPLVGCGMPLRVAAAAPAVAARMRGAARVDVRDHGALGDGVRDDTRAFQRAVDALPANGGTVHVPAGTYLIDPVRSVRLRSRMHLQLATGAKLVAKKNAAERAYVLTVQEVGDVEISGGRIVGDRDGHLGSTGEWGHGIMIRGSSRVTVRNIHVSGCWGDGISIGAVKHRGGGGVVSSSDVVIAGVVCTRNRRQGLTIGRSRRVRVRDSEFSDTSGTLPGCGIDIEPDAGDGAHDVRIENCLVRGNQGPGIQLYWRVSGVTITRCTIEGNRSYGVLAVGATKAVITRNRIRNNAWRGIGLRQKTRDVLVSGNHFRGNAPPARRESAARVRKPMAAHIETTKDTTGIRIAADNIFEG